MTLIGPVSLRDPPWLFTVGHYLWDMSAGKQNRARGNAFRKEENEPI